MREVSSIQLVDTGCCL